MYFVIAFKKYLLLQVPRPLFERYQQISRLKYY